MRKHLSGILAQLIKYEKGENWGKNQITEDKQLMELFRIDRQLYFTEPVTEDIAPLYFTIISHPMDFKTMRKKLKEGKYNSVDALQVTREHATHFNTKHSTCNTRATRCNTNIS
jgi:hypothetical protein